MKELPIAGGSSNSITGVMLASGQMLLDPRSQRLMVPGPLDWQRPTRDLTVLQLPACSLLAVKAVDRFYAVLQRHGTLMTL